MFDGDFKAETVKIDGVASPYSSYILGKKTFETTYAIPKKRGERFKRVAEVFLTRLSLFLTIVIRPHGQHIQQVK